MTCNRTQVHMCTLPCTLHRRFMRAQVTRYNIVRSLPNCTRLHTFPVSLPSSLSQSGGSRAQSAENNNGENRRVVWRRAAGLPTALCSRRGAAALCGGGASALCLYASGNARTLYAKAWIVCEKLSKNAILDWQSSLFKQCGVARLAFRCGGGECALPQLVVTRTLYAMDCREALQECQTFQTTKGPSMEQRLIAEAVGTGIIVQFGCGAVCALKYANAQFGLFGISCAWGIGVALAVYATRAVSGAHLNPAVTTALVSIDAFPAEEAPLYVAAQMLGATVAATVNYLVFSAGIAASEATASIVRGTAASTASFAGAFGMVPNTAITGSIGAFAAEMWMTSVLLFLILAIGDTKHGSVPEGAQPVLVGSAVAGLICIFGPVTGCGMNPARDLGPRLVTLLTGWGSAALTAGWVYTLGPCVGACLGAHAYKQTLASEVTRK